MNKDEQIQKLQQLVEQKKAEIKKIEKPNWKTNQSYKHKNNVYNILVIQDVDLIIEIVGSLLMEQDYNRRAKEMLGIIDKKSAMKDGYSIDAWVDDFRLRLDKINIQTKRAQLEKIEKQLLELESPEIKERRQLEEIEKLLRE